MTIYTAPKPAYIDDAGNEYTEFQLRCLIDMYFMLHHSVYPDGLEAQDVITEFLMGAGSGAAPIDRLNELDQESRDKLRERIIRRRSLAC